MSKVKVLFTTTHLPASWAIRTVTWSRWSHCAILIDDATVVEASMLGGVQKTPAKHLIDKAAAYAIVEFEVPDAAAAIEAALEQLNKPYDWTAVIGIGLHRDWQETDAWFCSELVAYCLGRGGLVLFRDDALRRVVPQHLWMFPAPVLQGVFA